MDEAIQLARSEQDDDNTSHISLKIYTHGVRSFSNTHIIS